MTDVRRRRRARALARGVKTRQKLLDAAEQVFGELGYHEASIVKITEAAGVGQGTFYLYFASKKESSTSSCATSTAASGTRWESSRRRGRPALEQELLGFKGYFRSPPSIPALYRIIRQSAFVSPEVSSGTTTASPSGTSPRCARRSTAASSARSIPRSPHGR